MGLEGFAVLTKKQEDLLKKAYCLQTSALVTVTTTSGPFLFKARASQRPDTSSVAKASLQYKKDKITVTPKRKTDGTSMYVLEYAHNSDLKMKSECRVTNTLAERSYETTVSAEYSQPKYKAKLALVEPNLALKASATAGTEDYGFAADGKFDFSAQRLVGYGFAYYWLQKQQRLVLKHVGTDKSKYAFGDSILSFYQSTSEKTAVAACIKFSHPRKETYIEFGGSHALTNDTELRGKVDSSGLLAAAFIRNFNDSVKLTLAMQVDMKKIVQANVSDYKLGLRLDLTS